MKKLPPQSLDLGLEDLIKDKTEEGRPSEPKLSTQEAISEPSELSTLFSRGEFGKVIDRTEKIFASDPEAALYWIRSQSALGAVPLSILIAPLEKTVFELMDNNSPLQLKMMAKQTFEEFASSEHVHTESKERLRHRLTELLGEEVPSFAAPQISSNIASPSQAEELKQSSIVAPIMVLLVLGVLAYFYYFRKSEDTVQFSPLPDAKVKESLITSELARQSVGSLDALWSDLIGSNAAPPTVVPTSKPSDVPEAALPSQKESVNTTSPIEPPHREEVRPEPEIRDRGDSNSNFYEVLADTIVLSRPTVDASPVTRLRRGALLEVVGRTGVFYEVESKGGKKGYVLMQDVSPPERNAVKPKFSDDYERRSENNYPNSSQNEGSRRERESSDLPPDPFSKESVERRYDR